MYLYGKRYTENWDHTKPENRWEVTIKKGNGPVEVINPTYVTEKVGYWRKANAIHKWFVDNAQGGTDDGGQHYVGRESLQELLITVEKVLAATTLALDPKADGKWTGPDGLPLPDAPMIVTDSTVAQELLPTQSGFFFGDTEYTQWYVQDLKDTVEILTRALALGEDYEFEYYASW